MLLFCLLLAACSVSDEQPDEVVIINEPTAEIVLTKSPTIDWFPATATSTVFPTRSPIPTEDKRGGVLQKIIVEDDFYGAEGGWQTWRNSAASIAYGHGELSVVVNQPKTGVTSLFQEPMPNAYYYEITATPNLCRGQDMFGVIVRATSQQDYYRFGINCDGQIRLDWIRSGTVTAMHEWGLSGQVLPGSLLDHRIGVWSVGNEMRFFIDGVYQFDLENARFPGGNIGVFAKSSGETVLNVIYSDMVVFAIGDIPSTWTPVPSATQTVTPSK